MLVKFWNSITKIICKVQFAPVSKLIEYLEISYLDMYVNTYVLLLASGCLVAPLKNNSAQRYTTNWWFDSCRKRRLNGAQMLGKVFFRLRRYHHSLSRDLLNTFRCFQLWTYVVCFLFLSVLLLFTLLQSFPLFFFQHIKFWLIYAWCMYILCSTGS